jgi:hypothetical protein
MNDLDSEILNYYADLVEVVQSEFFSLFTFLNQCLSFMIILNLCLYVNNASLYLPKEV